MRATVVLVLKGQCQFGELISFKMRAAEMGLSCNELAKRGFGVKQRESCLGFREISHQAMEISALLSKDSTRSHSEEFWPANKQKTSHNYRKLLRQSNCNIAEVLLYDWDGSQL